MGWIDALRLLACFMVVFAHCCDPFVAQFNEDRPVYLVGEFVGSMMRPCVPLFAMMTGVLLFPVKTSMGAFYRKRLGRLAVPFVFWSLALPLLYWLYFMMMPGTGSPSVDPEGFGWANQGGKLYTFVFNFCYDTTPLWYLYMLAGLYLIMPVASAWLEQAERKDVKLFLVVWFFSLFMPYLKLFAPAFGYEGNYGNMNIWGVCDWNAYGTFHYLSGFLGYMVLAHYLTKYPLNWSWKRLLPVSAVLFAAGYLITALGFDAVQQHYPGDYAYLEIIWLFTGINVFMMTLPLFCVMQKWNVQPCKWLSRMASYTFGIYLCHFVFVQVAYDLFDGLGLPTLVHIVLMVMTAFAVSLAIVAVLYKWKWTRRTVQ